MKKSSCISFPTLVFSRRLTFFIWYYFISCSIMLLTCLQDFKNISTEDITTATSTTIEEDIANIASFSTTFALSIASLASEEFCKILLKIFIS
jgi:hypothetical protein